MKKNYIILAIVVNFLFFLAGCGQFDPALQKQIVEPKNITINALSSIKYGSGITGISIDKNYAFYTIPSGLRIADISKPDKMSIISRIDIDGCNNLYVNKNYIYITTEKGLKIVDITDIKKTVLIGTLVSGNLSEIYGQGNYIYAIEDRKNIKAIDISNPSSPIVVGYIYETKEENVYLNQLCIKGNYAYLSDVENFKIIDITNISKPFVVSEMKFNEGIYDIDLNANYVFITTLNDIKIIDITNPANISVNYNINPTLGNIRSLYIKDNRAYITTNSTPFNDCMMKGQDGIKVLDVNNIKSPSLIGYIESTNLLHIEGNRLFSSDSVSSYSDFANLTIKDITDIKQIKTLGSLNIDERIRAIAIKDNYAYIAQSGAGLQVLDITNPRKPFNKGHVYTYAGANGLVLKGNYAYVADSSKGLTVIDITDPQKSKIVSSLNTNGNALNLVLNENNIYVINDNDIDIVDISNPLKPAIISSINGRAYKLYAYDNCVYIFDDERNIVAIDISDIKNPAIINKLKFYWTDVLFKDNYIYGFINYGIYNQLQVVELNKIRDASSYKDARSMTFTAKLTIPASNNNPYLYGNYIYTFQSNSSQIIDISDPAKVYIYAKTDSLDGMMSIYGNYAYIYKTLDTLNIMDISNLK